MSANTKIEWTDSTLNWWEGCTKVGPGCDHCYAEARNARFGGGQSVNWGPGAPRRLTSEYNRNSLRRWNKREFVQCASCGWRGEDRDCRKQEIGMVRWCCPACDGEAYSSARRRVFCSSLSDVFDNEVPQEWRDAFFAEMEGATNLDLLVLTKRIGNVRKMVPTSWLKPGGWPTQVWLGATIVDQPEADRDIQKLLAVPARVRFLSMEPLLGPVDLRLQRPAREDDRQDLDGYCARITTAAGNGIKWVIVGGESGPGARPMHPDWARSLRDQCQAAGVPFLFKQWGEWLAPMQDGAPDRDVQVINSSYSPVHVGKKAAGRLLDGRTWDGFPA